MTGRPRSNDPGSSDLGSEMIRGLTECLDALVSGDAGRLWVDHVVRPGTPTAEAMGCTCRPVASGTSVAYRLDAACKVHGGLGR